MKKHIANIITGSRIAFSLPLLFIPLSSAWFAILYLVCGLTDMVDGTIARKTGSVSKFGARLDTVADFVFMSVCCVKILPRKAGAHRDLYAPKRIFSRNTAAKSHGQRQPYRGFLPCLSRKSLALVCFAVLNRKFCFTAGLLWRKRFIQNRVNPYVYPPDMGKSSCRGGRIFYEGFYRSGS